MATAELQKVIEQYKTLAQNAAQANGPQELRAALAKTFSGFPSAGRVTCEAVSGGGLKAQWITAPEAAADRVILYLHGGGYVMGSIETHRELVARLSKAALARCLALDYRLAPENPFPAAVNDATAAYRWLLAQGIKPGRIVIAGDSAGGGLTLATLVALRDLGLPAPAAGVCISPWVDLEGTGDSMRTKAAEDPLVSREMILALAKLYVGEQGDVHDPLAAPLYADLTGLPPLFIQVGNAETLLDDATRVTERAEAVGVDVTLQIWDEMPHVWQWFAPILPEGQEAIDKIGEFVLKRTS
jgi:monoterpene epsilon-lactone hydrolase